jgi:CRISPR-associated exonuclease Cas4
METSSSLTASQMIEYLFCPRFTYFEYVLDIPQKEENRFKVQKGRQIHEKIRKTNPDYLRKKINAVKKQEDVYLKSDMGIRGIVDEILFFDDGTAAPLDYKFAEYKNKIFSTYRFQLVFYGKLIMDNYHLPVHKGFLVYTKSKNKMIEIEFSPKDFLRLEKNIAAILAIIDKGIYPMATKSKNRCFDCCYKNICEG